MKQSLCDVIEAIESLIHTHTSLHHNPSREDLIRKSLESREAIVSKSGALATWNPAHSTGRIPHDTYMVKDESTASSVDWSAAACNEISRETFDAILGDALEVLQSHSDVLVLDRSVGHDPKHSLGVRVVTNSALSSLFADTMFCEQQQTEETFTLIVLPYDDIDIFKHNKHLRHENGQPVPRMLAMDFSRKIGFIYGSQYCGCIKKTLFTVMNHLLPRQGILPLHCSANEGPEGSALFLGLSGTGKTTLSNDPERTLIGDDEHAWSDNGVWNMEGGCYAKLINLEQDKEPDIFRAVFEPKDAQTNGCIIENALIYPDGTVDTADNRLATNSRASYPLSFLPNTKERAVTSHPKHICFLTADAMGVLPPIAKLSTPAALFWFLMGYTSKLAGTEIGAVEPKASFSRFFGAPFMPCHPSVYIDLLAKKLQEHDASVYLINTGWTGGPYGVGKRFDIAYSRRLVEAVLADEISQDDCRFDNRFKVHVPTGIEGLDSTLLTPESTWKDAKVYTEAANALANQFVEHFNDHFSESHLPTEVIACCPEAMN